MIRRIAQTALFFFLLLAAFSVVLTAAGVVQI